MAVHSWRKSKPKDGPLPAKSSRSLERTMKANLSAAAGAEQFAHRDPLYHISENFMKSFDMIGRMKSRPDKSLTATGMKDPGKRSQQEENRNAKENAMQLAPRSSMDALFEEAPNDESRGFMGKFAETTFQRGNMAAAVMRGKGRMMLHSSLKRTIGQSQPKNFRQRKLFESDASVKRNVGRRSPDVAVFNRGEADGAVGLVVDVLRDARKTVDSLAKLAGGGNVLDNHSGAQTLQKMYPFLRDEKEQGMLAQYQAMLQSEENADKRLIISRSIEKTEALIQRKSQMKFQFMHHLRQISNQAEEASVLFEELGFRTALRQSISREFTEGEAPPDGGDDGAGADSAPGDGAPQGGE